MSDATHRPPARGLGSAEPGTECVRVDSKRPTVLGGQEGACELSAGRRAWASGYCFQGNEACIGRELAEAVCEALAAPDAGVALAGLNGSFWVVVMSAAGDRVDIVTDRIGTRPLYFAIEHGGLRIDDDFWRLCHGLGTATLSVAAAIELLTFDYVLGEHTLVEQIAEVAGGTHLEFRLEPQSGNAALVKQERYWRYDIQPVPRPRACMSAEFGAVLRRVGERCAALLQRWKVGTVGMNLSAGRDSRAVASLLHAAGVRMHCYTSGWAVQENRAAFAVAQALRCPHTFLPFWGVVSAQPREEIFWALAPTTKFSVANHVLGLGAYGTPGVDALVSGHLGDILSSAHTKVPTYARRGRGRAFVADEAVHAHTRWRPDALRPLLKATLATAADSGVRHLRELCAAAVVSHPLGLGAQIDIEQRQRRFILRDYLALRQLSLSLLPLNDYEFIDFFARVPFEWLLGGALYVSALHDEVFVGPRAALAAIPMNGERPRSVRHPLVWNGAHFAGYCAEALARRVKARCARRPRQDEAVSDKNYIGAGAPREWLADLDWLCNVEATRRTVEANLSNSAFVMSHLRALYTLARVSARVSGREGPACP